ncbi:glycoside hydrolase family 5 protein, partial [Streptomyces niveus]
MPKNPTSPARGRRGRKALLALSALGVVTAMLSPVRAGAATAPAGAATPSGAASPISDNGQLKVCGTKLCNSQGQAVQ